METAFSVEMFRFFETYQRWAMERVFAVAREAGSAVDRRLNARRSKGQGLEVRLAEIFD